MGNLANPDYLEKTAKSRRDWDIPRNKTELQSFLEFANYYRDVIYWHAKLVAPLHAMTRKGTSFLWGEEQKRAFNSIKVALMEATALAQPDTEGEFVLDTDASDVAISGIHQQWQGPPENRKLQPIVFVRKKTNSQQANYGALRLEMYAAYYFSLNITAIYVLGPPKYRQSPSQDSETPYLARYTQKHRTLGWPVPDLPASA